MKKSKRKPAFITCILTEMFSRVGRKFTPSACEKPGWYLKTNWSWEQQQDFQRWLADRFLKRGYTKQKSNHHAGMFILFFGWRVEDPKAAAGLPGRISKSVRSHKPDQDKIARSAKKFGARIPRDIRRQVALDRLAKLAVDNLKNPWHPSRLVSRHENLQNYSQPPMVVVVLGPANGQKRQGLRLEPIRND